MNVIGPSIIATSGLVVLLDATDMLSSNHSTTWTNINRTYATSGIFSNSPAWSDVVGGCYTFNGSNQYIAFKPTIEAGFSSNKHVSMFVWVSPASDGVIVSEQGGDGGWHDAQIDYSSTNKFGFGVWPYANKIQTSSTYAVNTWWYAGFICDSTTITGFVNGVSVGSATANRQAPYVEGATTLFYSLMTGDSTALYTTAYGDGKIGAFHVYNRPLTSGEVLQNYLATRRRFERAV